MINNRQNGRRRGRGGGPRSPNNAPNQGNRQENRSRGNASQLHEKYKALARDAQLAGDRVQTEYYLQFADHYFRVLSEGRARFEEQNNQRRSREDYGSDDDEYQDEAVNAAETEDRDEGEERSREEAEERPVREHRFERGDRDQRHANGDGRGRRNRGRQDREERDGDDAGEERISLESLPPPISIVDADDGARAPRRRARRPRLDGDEAEIAPAA